MTPLAQVPVNIYTHLVQQFISVLVNTYRLLVRLFILGGGEIPSAEGTTQEDPLAMAMYDLAIRGLHMP